MKSEPAGFPIHDRPFAEGHVAAGPALRDREILRSLGRQMAEEVMRQDRAAKAEMWRRNNDRDPVRKMVWLTEVPWHELRPHRQELVCLCTEPWLRELEDELRRTLYQWRHFPVDMILDDHIPCRKVWHSTGIGLVPRDRTLAQHDLGGIQAHHWESQIRGPDDIGKIRMPTVTYDAVETARRFHVLSGIFEGILPVKIVGIKHIWFTPWDRLFSLVDMTEMMMAMIEAPDFVNALVSRYVDASMHELDQVEALGLLGNGVDNIRVGSGAYAYTGDLTGKGAEADPVRCRDIWGCGNAQIFSEVSPDMHWEFSLKHELRWLERWGMNYYGCCEQLHGKIHLLDRIPNLRKFSLSPRCDIRKAREAGADKYVLSIKPNPALVAVDDWSPERARRQIRGILEATEGATAELVFKDISTVRNDPQRLDDWARVAMEEVERA
ncbi:MAG: hypothetical protein R3F07_11495 [Opitutaceae bacterium]